MKDELDKGYAALQHQRVWLSPDRARARKLWITILCMYGEIWFYEKRGIQAKPFSALTPLNVQQEN